MVNFPTSPDLLINPSPSSFVDDAGLELDVQISTLNDIVEALESELGAHTGAAGALHGYVRRSDAAGAGLWVPDASLALLNPIVNASLESWPVATSFTSIADATYGPDGFVYGKAGAVVHDLLRSTDVPAVAYNAPLGNYSLHLDVTTVDAAIAAGDYCTIATRIEGSDVLPFAQQAFVLSFWVKAAKTGTHCCYFKNSGSDRTYVGTYSVAVADTWEFKTIAVSASPSAGTWDYTTGIGLEIGWALSCGSTFQATAGAWQTGDFKGTSAQVNETDNTANNFKIFAPKVTLGTVAGLFAKLPTALNALRCQRYYQKSWAAGTSVGTATQFGAVLFAGSDNNTTKIVDVPVRFKQSMRTTPTVTLYDNLGASGKISTVNAAGTLTDGVTPSTGSVFANSEGTTVLHSGTVAGIMFHYAASARL